MIYKRKSDSHIKGLTIGELKNYISKVPDDFNLFPVVVLINDNNEELYPLHGIDFYRGELYVNFESLFDKTENEKINQCIKCKWFDQENLLCDKTQDSLIWGCICDKRFKE